MESASPIVSFGAGAFDFPAPAFRVDCFFRSVPGAASLMSPDILDESILTSTARRSALWKVDTSLRWHEILIRHARNDELMHFLQILIDDKKLVKHELLCNSGKKNIDKILKNFLARLLYFLLIPVLVHFPTGFSRI